MFRCYFIVVRLKTLNFCPRMNITPTFYGSTSQALSLAVQDRLLSPSSTLDATRTSRSGKSATLELCQFPTMTSMTIFWTSYVVNLFLVRLFTVVHRLFISSLAKFPGRKLAASTHV